jgi:hypothetical protein
MTTAQTPLVRLSSGFLYRFKISDFTSGMFFILKIQKTFSRKQGMSIRIGYEY